MNIQQYSNFLRLQGYKVINTGSCMWYNIRPLFYESFPIGTQYRPDSGDLARMFLLHFCFGVRYVCHPDEPGSQTRSLFLCTDTNYDLSTLHSKARNQTRRGLERCSIRQVEMEYLKQEGFRVKSVAHAQQGLHRVKDLDSSRWKRYMDACAAFPEDTIAFGAFFNDELCGFVVAIIVEDYAMIQTFHNSPDKLANYSANALIFVATQTLFQRKSVNRITLGAQTLNPIRELERFKTRMGFHATPQSYRLFLHPAIKTMLAAPHFSTFVSSSLVRRPHNPYIYRAIQVLNALQKGPATDACG